MTFGPCETCREPGHCQFGAVHKAPELFPLCRGEVEPPDGWTLCEIKKGWLAVDKAAATPSATRPLTAFERAASFAKAVRNAGTGGNRSSHELIEARLTICQDCDQFDQTAGKCGLCGCPCNGKPSFWNKLAHTDQVCPDGKW